MEKHRKECPLQEVECHECRKMLQRQYMTSHVETECPCRLVECQYCHITGEHQFIEGEHKEQCPKLPLSCPNECEIGSVPREVMEVHRKECPLEMVQCEYHNVGCEKRMMRKDLEVHKKEEMEKHLSLTSSQLSNALKNIDKMMTTLHSLVQKGNNDKHSASDILVAQWSLNSVARKETSDYQVCPVVVHVSNIHLKKSIICRDSAFYSHEKGYKMFLRVDPAGQGSGKGTHLSLYLCLMKGPHDDELTWPLREKFEIKLLNQISDCEHTSRVLIFDDRTSVSRVILEDGVDSWGRSQFVSNIDLYKITPTCQYLKNNGIFLQVSRL